MIMTAVSFRPVAASCTGECQKSGPLGLVVIIVLCVGCYFLFKSMSKHLKRVREDYPAELPADRPRPTSAAPIVPTAGGRAAVAGDEPAWGSGPPNPPGVEDD